MTRSLCYPVAAAAVAAAAFLPAAAAGKTVPAGPAPMRARITGAAIPGTATTAGNDNSKMPVTAPAAAPAAGAPIPGRREQIRTLTAALRYMNARYKTLAQSSPGVTDIDDYGIGSLWRRGLDGAGTTIAVIEGWNFPQISSVVARFDKQLDLPAARIQTIYPAGPLPRKCPSGMVNLGSYGSCQAWQGELTLDVVAAHMIAPYAKILISATPADTEESDDAASQVAPPEMMKALEDISAHRLANVISISDGTGETTYSAGGAEIRAQDPGELAAAQAGIPVLAATGDCGVVQNLAVATGQCEDTSGTPDTAAWDDSPWVTAVGGSVPDYSMTTPARLGPDPLWDAPPFSEGAGFSSVFTRPGYQDDVARITGSPMRSVPDITMDAQDGTSEAAPLMAGVLALATQLNHGDVGPVNPALYGVLGPAGARDGIADVVSGNDSLASSEGQVTVPGFTAGPGFDVASGWGTVFAPRFVPGLVAVTRAYHQEAVARARARAELNGLRTSAISLTPTSTGDYYLLAGGFLPGRPVRLTVGGTKAAALTANPLGDVTYMISPSRFGLSPGWHPVALAGMLITETSGFGTAVGGEVPRGG